MSMNKAEESMFNNHLVRFLDETDKLKDAERRRVLDVRVSTLRDAFEAGMRAARHLEWKAQQAVKRIDEVFPLKG